MELMAIVHQSVSQLVLESPVEPAGKWAQHGHRVSLAFGLVGNCSDFVVYLVLCLPLIPS